jgi:hypothetical protein
MPSSFKYTHGLGHVPSYQASARPYFTSSLTVPASGSEPLEISFDSVSRFIIVTNELGFGASANGVKGVENANYGIIRNGVSFEAEFKVTKIYLMSDTVNQGSASVIAGLTGIEQSHLANNWSGSAGVG